jgi:hypothetical protein
MQEIKLDTAIILATIEAHVKEEARSSRVYATAEDDKDQVEEQLQVDAFCSQSTSFRPQQEKFSTKRKKDSLQSKILVHPPTKTGTNKTHTKICPRVQATIPNATIKCASSARNKVTHKKNAERGLKPRNHASMLPEEEPFGQISTLRTRQETVLLQCS